MSAPHCDMTRACTSPITKIDRKGYVYCDAHGSQRKSSGIPCRKLRPAELATILGGQPIASYTAQPTRQDSACEDCGAAGELFDHWLGDDFVKLCRPCSR